MSQSPWAASKDRFAWQEGDPWSSWTGPFVTLHLYRPSGEFICEDFAYRGSTVDNYCQYLEEGRVTHELSLMPEDYYRQGFCYRLVWKDLVLGEMWQSYDILQEHGMSSTEPNDAIGIKTDTGVIYDLEESPEEEPPEP
jgi:hypothetical protein